MTRPTRWTVDPDADGHPCVWVWTGDDDPRPRCVVWPAGSGRWEADLTDWPFGPDELADAMVSLHHAGVEL